MGKDIIKIVQFTLLTVLLYTVVIVNAQNNTSQDCRYTKINLQGTANADITVSSTAVVVMAVDNKRCNAEIHNVGSSDMRCAPQGLTPTSTVGKLIPSNTWLDLDTEAVQQWSCIRVTSDTAANVTEVTR